LQHSTPSEQQFPLSSIELELQRIVGSNPGMNCIIVKYMIRKLKSGEYRLYSRKKNPQTGKRRNLGTFRSLAQAKQHERAVQFFKRH